MMDRTMTLAVVGVLMTPLAASAQIQLTEIGRYETGLFLESAAEIVAHDPVTQRLFVTSSAAATIDVLDVSDPANLSLLFQIDLTPWGSGPNSVAAMDGLIAVAVEADVKTDPGQAVFFDADGTFLVAVTVGAQPDMITFAPNGRFVLTADEGEPNDDYTIDPKGSVSIIDLIDGIQNLEQDDVTTVTFDRFNRNGFIQRKLRIFGPGASIAQDLEPEYIAIAPNSRRAYVTLQENNGFAIIDLYSKRVVALKGFGVKEHSLPGNELDVSDDDGVIDIANWPVSGFYLPDAIGIYKRRGTTYLVTANEGDARDWAGFAEESRVSDLALDPIAFPDADLLQQDHMLGRLTVTTTHGDADGDGMHEELFCFGARSFSIWRISGGQVYDSGADFEEITAAALPDEFNSTNDENDSFDNRSDNKGPEPEGLTLGEIDGRMYAFIGLERIGGIMVYDITEPRDVQFVQYINNRDFTGDAEAGTAGDLGPEGLLFIDAAESPIGVPLLVVANEVSGSTTVYRID